MLCQLPVLAGSAGRWDALEAGRGQPGRARASDSRQVREGAASKEAADRRSQCRATKAGAPWAWRGLASSGLRASVFPLSALPFPSSVYSLPNSALSSALSSAILEASALLYTQTLRFFQSCYLSTSCCFHLPPLP